MLFQLGDFKLASGAESKWKIDCDSFYFDDWEALAYIASINIPSFGKVEGVPRGGIPFAKSLEKYIDPTSDILLIAEDVVTTGGSMERFRNGRDAIGVAVFSRYSVCPNWIFPLFKKNF